MIAIRLEEPRDISQIYRVNQLAFGQTGEGNLVNALRNSNELTLSLVAEADGEIIGHIAFSPVTIKSEDTTVHGLGLGPMAVLPNFQRTGIGYQLMVAGIKECEKPRMGWSSCSAIPITTPDSASHALASMKLRGRAKRRTRHSWCGN